MSEKKSSTNIGKIVAITLAVVAGACAVIWFALKLYRKYCLLECDYIEEEEGEELFGEDDECEVVVEAEDGAVAEEAASDESEEG